MNEEILPAYICVCGVFEVEIMFMGIVKQFQFIYGFIARM